MYTIAEVASDIYTEIGDDTLTTSSIEVWIKANTGYISTLTNVVISLVDNEYSIEIDDQLKAVITYAYITRYYKGLMKNSLTNAYGQILSFKDDKSSVRFASASEVAKSYKSMYDDYSDRLLQVLTGYKRNNSIFNDPTMELSE